jgi:hypothetical protein
MLHQAKMQNCALAVAYQKTASFVALAWIKRYEKVCSICREQMRDMGHCTIIKKNHMCVHKVYMCLGHVIKKLFYNI